MLEIQKLEDNIVYYKNVYPNSKEFLDYVKSIPGWKVWSSSNNEAVYGELIGGSTPLPDLILNTIKNSISLCLSDYCSRTGLEFGWIPDFYTVQKYNTMAYMGPHVDSIDKTSINSPTISIVVYLNDDYEGGELVFPEQGITIKPESGSMVIFPSYPPYYHDPKPVTSGDKYMSPVFCFKEPF